MPRQPVCLYHARLIDSRTYRRPRLARQLILDDAVVGPARARRLPTARSTSMPPRPGFTLPTGPLASLPSRATDYRADCNMTPIFARITPPYLKDAIARGGERAEEGPSRASQSLVWRAAVAGPRKTRVDFSTPKGVRPPRSSLRTSLLHTNRRTSGCDKAYRSPFKGGRSCH
jgi:hypothetical protein